MEEKDGEQVGVTLFPADYETVAMVTEQGDEMLHELSPLRVFFRVFWVPDGEKEGDESVALTVVWWWCCCW